MSLLQIETMIFRKKDKMIIELQIKDLAHRLYQKRLTRNIRGNADCDWFHAEFILKLCEDFDIDLETYMQAHETFASVSYEEWIKQN